MKDPAFLFYPSDFLSGTMFFTDEQLGKYIRLLCAQHQHGGSLTENQMNFICKSYDNDVWSKFQKLEDGTYRNERLHVETTKRQKYCESRGNNKRGKTKEDDMKIISKSYDNHMGNRNINRDIDKKEDKLKYADSVLMTETEHNKLVSDFGLEATTWMINKLSNYKISSGKKYKSDYRAILSWAVDSWNEFKSKQPIIKHDDEWFKKHLAK